MLDMENRIVDSQEESKVLCKAFDEFNLRIVRSYVRGLNLLFDRYDTAVFVARKALCFYYALLSNGLIERPPNCRILSSRAASYKTISSEALGRVVVIDDVLISGQSISHAYETLVRRGIASDLFVAAASPEISDGEAAYLKVSTSIQLSRIQAYRLAKQITRFIRLSGVTNNVDQPIIQVTFDNPDAVCRLFDDYPWVDLETPDQIAAGITNKTLTLRREGGLSNRVLEKARVVCRAGSSSVNLIPFVLLDAMTAVEISELFSLSNIRGVDDDAFCDSDARFAALNQLRALQYVLAYDLAKELVARFNGVASWCVDINHEEALFGLPLSIERDAVDGSWGSGFGRGRFAPAIDRAEVDECSCATYRRLMDEGSRVGSSFTNALGEGVGRNMLTFGDIEMTACRMGDALEGEIDTLISTCIDSLIDEGVLVPFAAYSLDRDGDERLVRAYRSGEIFDLQNEQLAMFCNMLHFYLEESGRVPLSAATANRLAVLYMRSPDGADADSGWGRDTSRESAAYDLRRFELTSQDELSSLHAGSVVEVLEKCGLVELANGNVVSASLGAFGVSRDSRRKDVDFAKQFVALSKATEQDELDAWLERMIVGYSASYLTWFIEKSLDKLLRVLSSRARPDALAFQEAIVDLKSECERASKSASVLDDLTKLVDAEIQGSSSILLSCAENANHYDKVVAETVVRRARTLVDALSAPEVPDGLTLRCWADYCANLRSLIWSAGEASGYATAERGIAALSVAQLEQGAAGMVPRKEVALSDKEHPIQKSIGSFVDSHASGIVWMLPSGEFSLALMSDSAASLKYSDVEFMLPKRFRAFAVQLGSRCSNGDSMLVMTSRDKGGVDVSAANAVLQGSCYAIKEEIKEDSLLESEHLLGYHLKCFELELKANDVVFLLRKQLDLQEDALGVFSGIYARMQGISQEQLCEIRGIVKSMEGFADAKESEAGKRRALSRIAEIIGLTNDSMEIIDKLPIETMAHALRMVLGVLIGGA